MRVSFAIVLAAAMAVSESPAGVIESPFGVSYSPRGDSVVVAWYYPGMNSLTVGDRSREPQSYFIYSSQYVGARVARRFDLAERSVAVDAVEMRFWPNDPYPDLPGNQSSPFRISLYQQLPVNVESSSLWAATVACSTGIESNAWVAFPVRRLLQTAGQLFVAIEWLAESPSAPALAVSNAVLAVDQWAGESAAGAIPWSPLADLDLHLRVKYSLCDTVRQSGSSSAAPDSFSIFTLDTESSTADPGGGPIPGTAALHYTFAANAIEGKYVTIAAWKDGKLGPKSPAIFIDLITSADSDLAPLPPEDKLYQNFPNPFNHETVIFSTDEREIQVFDILGRAVRRLASRSPGPPFEFRFDGRDNAGRELPSGIYLYRQSPSEPARRMIFLK